MFSDFHITRIQANRSLPEGPPALQHKACNCMRIKLKSYQGEVTPRSGLALMEKKPTFTNDPVLKVENLQMLWEKKSCK